LTQIFGALVHLEPIKSRSTFKVIRLKENVAKSVGATSSERFSSTLIYFADTSFSQLLCVVNISHYKNKNWLQFLFFVKAASLKQQISEFIYPQIVSTEDSFDIYVRPLTEYI